MVTEKVKGYVQLWYFGPFGVMNNCFAWYIQYPGVRCPVQSIPPVSPSCLVAWCGQPRCWGSQYSAWLLPLQPQPSVKATHPGMSESSAKRSRFWGKKILPASRGSWRSTLVGVTWLPPRSCVCSTAGSHCRKVELLGLAFLRLGHGGTLAMVVLKTTGWMGEHWQCGIMWTSGRTFRTYVILHESWKIGHIFFKSTTACPVATFQIVIAIIPNAWYCKSM